ncbi:hypothetical protein KBD45_00870 [Candidatus Dojkabacteria bacterium]|nr:hypothetical protein [Candidatus Dojkabacteria bacterium]
MSELALPSNPERPIQIMHPFVAAVQGVELVEGQTNHFQNLRRIMVLGGLSNTFVVPDDVWWSGELQNFVWGEARNHIVGLNGNTKRFEVNKDSNGYRFSLYLNRKASIRGYDRFVNPQDLLLSPDSFLSNFERNFRTLQRILYKYELYEEIDGQRIEITHPDLDELTGSKENLEDQLLFEMGFKLSSETRRGRSKDHILVNELRRYVQGIESNMYLPTQSDSRVRSIIDFTPIRVRENVLFSGLWKLIASRILGYKFRATHPQTAQQIAMNTNILDLDGNQVEPLLNPELKRAIRCSKKSGKSSPYRYIRNLIPQMTEGKRSVPFNCRVCAQRGSCADLFQYVTTQIGSEEIRAQAIDELTLLSGTLEDYINKFNVVIYV